MAQLPVVLWTPKPAKSLVSTTMASNAHAFGAIFICEHFYMWTCDCATDRKHKKSHAFARLFFQSVPKFRRGKRKSA